MTIGPVSQCGVCQRVRGPFSRDAPEWMNGPWCAAFPEGIPPKIFDNTIDHRQPVEGDHGLQWIAEPGMKYPHVFRPNRDTLTAAAPPTTTTGATTLALLPSAGWVAEHAADDGLPPGDLHVTLAYLGGQPIPDPIKKAVLSVAAQLAANNQPIEAEGFAVSLFNPLGDNPCVALSLSGDSLDDLHRAAISQLANIPGVDLSGSKRPWAAHLTLTYTDDHYAVADLVDRCGPVRLDRLRVAFGGEVSDFQLGQPAPTTGPPPEEETMPWEIVHPDQPGCSDGWAVVNQVTGEMVACHDSAAAAKEQLQALYAREPQMMALSDSAVQEAASYQEAGDECPPGQHKMPDGSCMPDERMVTARAIAANGTPWHVYVPEGLWSGDGRQFALGALMWDRALLPYPALWQPENMPEHDGSVIVGRVDGIARIGTKVCLWGVLDDAGEHGAEAKRLMEGGFLRGASPTIDDVQDNDVELICPSPVMDEMGEELAEVCAAEPKMMVHRGRIRSVTFVAEPAFPEALVSLGPPPSDLTDAAAIIVAASYTITIPDVPPESWFEPPAQPPPFGALHITGQGQVYGYLAPAGVAHRAFRASGQMVTAPRQVDYSEFLNKPALVASPTGEVHQINAGNITFGCGHMAPNDPRRADPRAALEHYDNSCSVAARVRVGEDQHGTWVAGALLSTVDAGTVERMMACALSGDWQGGRLNAALLVPVEGFPVPVQGSVRVKDGMVVASVAPILWGVPKPLVASDSDLSAVFDRIARAVGQDVETRMRALAARVDAIGGT